MLFEKFYQGTRTETGLEVLVICKGDGWTNKQTLNPRFDLWNHSPCGFEWGYGGSGPAQLALAILADALGDDEAARINHQDFKFLTVANFPRAGFLLYARDVILWYKSDPSREPVLERN